MTEEGRSTLLSRTIPTEVSSPWVRGAGTGIGRDLGRGNGRVEGLLSDARFWARLVSRWARMDMMSGRLDTSSEQWLYGC